MDDSGSGNARLACFELWGGNSREVHPIELPGLRGWVSCTPFGDAAKGGDVHYISVCSKGQMSRIALADVLKRLQGLELASDEPCAGAADRAARYSRSH